MSTARRVLLALLVAGLAAAVPGPSAMADFPYLPASGGDRHDPQTFKLAPGETPTNFGNDWKLRATPEISQPSMTTDNPKQSELCGVTGMSLVDSASTFPGGTGSCLPAGAPVRTAFQSSTGRPDVTIAVLDSGIMWDDPGAMTGLRKKVRLNQGELPAPQHDRTNTDRLDPAVDCTTLADATPTNYDVNNDGVVNVLDYACDSRVSTTNPLRHGPPRVLTPEDLILAFGNCQIDQATRQVGTCTPGRHYDNDHNGFANDIAGWDFVDNKNNPYDDVHYSHGTGEAFESNGEANTNQELGTCPNCTVMPLRVGQSFIADVNRFAQAVLYGTDNGVYVIQEALGTLNNSSLARDAITYAYDHGTAVVASAADEAAEHHNQPGVLPHTILVNSLRSYDSTFTPIPRSYLQFNGCTNFSTKLVVSVPSTRCSSEATGKAAGVAGLIYSAALNAQAAGNLAPNPTCRRPNGRRCVLSANEVRQLMGTANIGGTTPADMGTGQADDVNFAQQPEPACAPVPTPSCTDPNRNMAFSTDQNGGRVISPLADSQRYPARKGTDEFYGYGRLNAYKAVSAAANATIPPEAEITSPEWFAQLDPAKPSIELDGRVASRSTSYTCTVEVAPGGQPNNARTTDSPPGDFKQVPSSYCDGTTPRSSPYSGVLANIDVPSLRAMFPASTVGPNFDGREPGLAYAQTSNGRPSTMPYAFTVRVVVTASGSTPMTGEDRRQLNLHRDAETLNAHFPIDLRTDGASSPLLVDVDGDNRNELVVATSDGVIHAYRPDGTEVPGWPVHTDPLPLHSDEVAFSSAGGPVSAPRYGAVLGSLAAGDLFHDGRIEIVADDLEGKIYAWDGSGNQVFRQEANPAYSGNPTYPGNPASEYQTIRLGHRSRTEHGFGMAPVLAHLDGNPNGPLSIIASGFDRHLYAWHPDGSAVPGFPVEIVDPSKISSIDPVTHAVTFDDSKAGPDRDPGDSNRNDQGKLVDTPAVADITGSGRPAIIVGSNEEYGANVGNEGAFNAGNFNTSSLQGLNQTGVLSFGNTRIYAVKPDGTAGGNPFLAGWPFKVAIIFRSLLPDVGEGLTGSPVVGPVTCPSGPDQGKVTLKVGTIPDAGPGYILNRDGSSCYGTDPSSGAAVGLQSDFSAGAGKYDTPAIPAAGDPSFGSLGGQVTFLAPATGAVRALDLAASEYQGGQDFLAAWNPSSGQFTPGWPSPVNDLQFLTGPSVGQIDQVGASESAVEGTASQDLAAIGATGAPAGPNWPKLTADWTVAYPTLGSFGTRDTDSGASKDVISITRYGTLTAYSTPAPACSPSSWPRYHHDIANSGDYTRDAVPPGRPFNGSFADAKLTFTAPGNDLLCGTANAYQAVTSDTPITPQSFASARPIGGLPAPQAAGSRESITLPAGIGRYVAIRATDAAGNVGLPLVTDTGSANPIPLGSGTPGGGSPSGGSPAGGSGPLPGGLLSLGHTSPCLQAEPRSVLSHRLGRRRLHSSIILRGLSVETGCAPSSIRAVWVSVARLRAAGRCQFLGVRGLGRPRSCRRPVYVRARMQPARGGRVRWALRLPRALPRGRYRVLAQAVDAGGVRETRASAARRLLFHVGRGRERQHALARRRSRRTPGRRGTARRTR